MSDAIISAVVTQLGSIVEKQVRQELKLVLGVDKEVTNLTQTFTAIKAVITDAVRRQIKTHDDESQSIKLWLQNLQEVAYEMDDVLSEWGNALLKIEIEGIESSSTSKKKVCFFINLPCFCFGRYFSRRDLAVKIREINEKLTKIASDRERYNFSQTNTDGVRIHSTSYVDVSKVRGRDGDRATLVAKLLEGGSQGGSDSPYDTISLVGTGGIGKTTLARLAYNDMEGHFDRKVWICVSEPPFDDELRVAKAIVEQLQGETPNLSELQPVLGRLGDLIKGEKLLLVLDDVWTEDSQKWESLRISLNCVAHGSKVLVTTRNERVAQIMESCFILHLGKLTEDDCWLLFSQIAFHGRNEKQKEEFENVGREIARKCNGLPLAAKIIGDLMRFKDSIEDWNNVEKSDMWKLEAKRIFPPLFLSYNDLPSAVKNCFLYCANFPQDYEIEADNLIKLWMAHDCLGSDSDGNAEMEEEGKKYLETLMMRSLFEMGKQKRKGHNSFRRFKMHDMVLQLAQYLRKNESVVMEVNNGLVIPGNSSSFKPRHLTLVRSEDSPFPESIQNIESLHSFWVQSFFDSPSIVSQVDRITPELLQRLVHLKTLDLSHNRLRDLPKEIEKVQNLRYLNLSYNPIWELPETICVLYRLQTLKLVACNQLSRLPEKISKLRNLRHLEIDRTDSLITLPKGIGRLTSLRTLSKFVLTQQVNDSKEEETCTITDLSSLNHLRGSIKLQGLGYAVDPADAAKAALKKKKNLTDLHMDFHPHQQQVQGRITDVAEALELHSDMQTLHISFYNGGHLPGWITSLTRLTKLRLEECTNCTSLPPLGTLPSLENLCLEKMHGLKLLGAELFKLSPAMASSTAKNGAAMFPKLKKLKLSSLDSLEAWSINEQEETQEILPGLQYLKISGCRRLKALPNSWLPKIRLRKLYIQHCPLLQPQYQEKTGEHRMKISHIPTIRV